MNDITREGIILSLAFILICFIIPSTFAAESVALSDQTKKQIKTSGSSVELLRHAWGALENNDLEAVITLTDECIRRYGKRARMMQDGLNGYATGVGADIRSYWALNDVSTALFIKGKAYQNVEMYEEAVAAYKMILDDYSYGQCWDPRGWFWKPAEVARDNMAMIETGVFFDYGDYTSETLVVKAWEALEKEDINLVLGYTSKCIDLYEGRALEMQMELDGYPKGSDEDIFKYWALNDVATAHYIRGRAYLIAGQKEDAIKEFTIVREKLFYGQCWDPKGWFWRPATEVDNWLETLKE